MNLTSWFENKSRYWRCFPRVWGAGPSTRRAICCFSVVFHSVSPCLRVRKFFFAEIWKTAWQPTAVNGYVLFILLLLPGLTAAAPAEEKQRRLEALQQRIGELEETRTQTRGQKKGVLRELEEMERQAGALSRALHGIGRDLEERAGALEQLRREQELKRRSLRRQRDELHRQLRGAFILGRQKRLKLLLNQEDPGRVSRITAYYEYLSRSRAQRIHEIHAWVEELQAVAAAVAEEQGQLERLRVEREEERQRLERIRGQRKALLAGLDRTLQEKETAIRELKQDATALRRLMERLALAAKQAEERAAKQAEALAAKQTQEQAAKRVEEQPRQSLRARKGRLPWPAAGRLSAAFGSRRAAGGLTWDGAVISAPEGSEIKAVHHGRVAYADWLRGFGLLVILDHGDGYMTLYGFNQTLLKETGEWVAEGDAIALVGDSGGRKTPGLYFGIRHQGRPRNPRLWCRRLRGGKTG